MKNREDYESASWEMLDKHYDSNWDKVWEDKWKFVYGAFYRKKKH